MGTLQTGVERVMLKVEDGTEMQALVASSAGSGQAAPPRGIIVLQEAFGVNDYIMRMTQRMAAAGYLAIAPEIFHRTAPAGWEADYVHKVGVGENMSAVTDEGLTGDLRAAYGWLVAQGIAPKKIAVIGFCMGGRAAFLANVVLPIASSVSFYGGGIAQTLLSRSSELHGPQLLIWGGKDAHIPVEHTRMVTDALLKEGKPFVEATFSEAGHGFACDARDSYHEKSAVEAWVLTDEFLANQFSEN